MNSITNLSVQQLRQAANLKEKIARLEKDLGRILGFASVQAEAPRKKYKMSAAGRAKIAAAVKARWAKVNGAKKSVKSATRHVKRVKRKMSAAARAKISKAAKLRWAKAKAQGKKSL